MVFNEIYIDLFVIIFGSHLWLISFCLIQQMGERQSIFQTTAFSCFLCIYILLFSLFTYSPSFIFLNCFNCPVRGLFHHKSLPGVGGTIFVSDVSESRKLFKFKDFQCN